MKDFLEEELNRRRLPDLLTIRGRRATTAEEWECYMRPYWKNILLQNEYGAMPPVLQAEISEKKNSVDFAGKAIWKEVCFSFRHRGKSHAVPTQMIVPVGIKKPPVWIYLNFRPDIPDRYLPVEEIIDHGFALFVVCYQDITSDDADFTNGLAGLFHTGRREPAETGKLLYWAYMASRMMDYLTTREEIDATAIGIAGHSRLGKTALLAAALDERFAFVCANDSGCSGAALSRGRSQGGESLFEICKKFNYWFCPKYCEYVGKEHDMPFDQDALLALIAPRIVIIGAAEEDIWADNNGQFLSCISASRVWRLYGKKGLIAPDRFPTCGDNFMDGEVGFYLRKGKHYHSRTDWLIAMETICKVLHKNAMAIEKDLT